MVEPISKSGPKTAAGKKRSAQNAIKSGLYTAQLIAGESLEAYAAVRSSLIEDFEAHDALGLSAVEELAITAVRKNRIFAAERHYMAGIMQTEDARKALGQKLFGAVSYARGIPWWYLDLEMCRDKRNALKILTALNQIKKMRALELQQDDQVIAQTYPEAYELIGLYRQSSSETFWRILIRVTQKQHISTCLDAIDAKVRDDYHAYVDWAENATRYLAAAKLVYAEFQMQLMAKPEMIKLMNSLNRQTEHALSVLHARDKLLGGANEALTVAASDECHQSTVVVMQSADKEAEDESPTNQTADESVETKVVTSMAQVVPTAPSNEAGVAGSSAANVADNPSVELAHEGAQKSTSSSDAKANPSKPSKPSTKGAKLNQLE